MHSSTGTVLSIVIVSYNVKQFVLDGISSIYKFYKSPVQIVLVDNNSSDGTIEAVKASFNDVVIVENKTNNGFSKANNQGFELCTGDYVLMLNPDAELIDESLQEMVKFLQDYKKNQFVLIGPALLNSDLSEQVSCWKFPSPLQHILELFFLNSWFDITTYSKSKLKNTTNVDFVSGACILMNKATLSELKGLDVNLFWMDDVDFGKRNILNGGENIYFPHTKVKHYIGQSSKKNQNVAISNQIMSKLKFYKKNKQHFSFFISIPVFSLQIISRIPLFAVLGILKPFYLIKFRAYVFTLRKFFSYLFLGTQTIS